MNTIKAPNISLQSGTFHVAMWGCQMNVYDAQRITDLMGASGYAQRNDPRDADVIILVTCAIRAKAQDKVFNQISNWKSQGVIRDDTVLALGGCVGSELADEIVRLEPAVSVVFGPRTAHRLPELIGRYHSASGSVVDVDADALEKFDTLPLQGMRGPSAFVTIMEGCSNNCSYCVVPFTRGGEDSRPVSHIREEVLHHIGNGVKEIHLLGQNVNSYRGLSDTGGMAGFSTLLYEIAAIPGVERIRFTTSNPMEFTDDIIQAIGELDVIADSVHIPVQSGSDTILRKMKRTYSADDYRRLADKLRKARPGVQISTDIIVGFPGESDDDFEDTMRLVDDVRFDQSFSFIYSPRPGTPAASLADATPREVKKQRLYRLQKRLEELAAMYSGRMVGTSQRVLVEGFSKKDRSELKSRASNNRIVVFEGDESLIGQMADVRISRVLAHTLKGEII